MITGTGGARTPRRVDQEGCRFLRGPIGQISDIQHLRNSETCEPGDTEMKAAYHMMRTNRQPRFTAGADLEMIRFERAYGSNYSAGPLSGNLIHMMRINMRIFGEIVPTPLPRCLSNSSIFPEGRHSRRSFVRHHNLMDSQTYNA
jgi:hypothetical protein